MCSAALQSASYWTPVEKLFLHLSPVTRRKAVKDQTVQNGVNKRNVEDQRSYRDRRTRSESSSGDGSSRVSLESSPKKSIFQHRSPISTHKSIEKRNRSPSNLSGSCRVGCSHHRNSQKDTGANLLNKGGASMLGVNPVTPTLTSSHRNHRNLLRRNYINPSHVAKTSINSSSSNSLSSPTSGSASSENEEPSLFANEMQTMKCHCLYKVRRLCEKSRNSNTWEQSITAIISSDIHHKYKRIYNYGSCLTI